MPHYCLLSCFLLLFWKGQKSTQNRVIQSYCQRWNGHRFLSDLQRKLFKCEEGIPFESAVLLDHHIDKTQDHGILFLLGGGLNLVFSAISFPSYPSFLRKTFAWKSHARHTWDLLPLLLTWKLLCPKLLLRRWGFSGCPQVQPEMHVFV